MPDPSTYQCGVVEVSRLEMRHSPYATFAIIRQRYGEDAARRLYEQWWREVPKVGAENHVLWQDGWRMQEELGLRDKFPTVAVPAGTPTFSSEDVRRAEAGD